MQSRILKNLLFLFAAIFNGCAPPGPDPDSKVVFVSIEPQAFLVERLAGDHVEIEVMVPPGQAPETYEPTPSSISRLADARIYFAIGIQFENSFLSRIESNLPHLKIVDTSTGIEKREIEEHSHGEGEDHGHEHAHGPGTLDPHIWLDPLLMVEQAKSMKSALAEVFPDSADTMERNFLSLQSDLEDLDERISQRLEPFWGKSLFVFHPAYGYFCDRYGLFQVPVESAGKEPNSKEFVELVRKARESKTTSLFVQPQFASSTVDVLAREIGAEVVRIDPLSRDYIRNFEVIATKVEEALKKAKATE